MGRNGVVNAAHLLKPLKIGSASRSLVETIDGSCAAWFATKTRFFVGDVFHTKGNKNTNTINRLLNSPASFLTNSQGKEGKGPRDCLNSSEKPLLCRGSHVSEWMRWRHVNQIPTKKERNITPDSGSLHLSLPHMRIFSFGLGGELWRKECKTQNERRWVGSVWISFIYLIFVYLYLYLSMINNILFRPLLIPHTYNA